MKINSIHLHAPDNVLELPGDTHLCENKHSKAGAITPGSYRNTARVMLVHLLPFHAFVAVVNWELENVCTGETGPGARAGQHCPCRAIPSQKQSELCPGLQLAPLQTTCVLPPRWVRPAGPRFQLSWYAGGFACKVPFLLRSMKRLLDFLQQCLLPLRHHDVSFQLIRVLEKLTRK